MCGFFPHPRHIAGSTLLFSVDLASVSKLSYDDSEYTEESDLLGKKVSTFSK